MVSLWILTQSKCYVHEVDGKWHLMLDCPHQVHGDEEVVDVDSRISDGEPLLVFFKLQPDERCCEKVVIMLCPLLTETNKMLD